jgi:multiple sugar transport system permease protein
MNDQDRNEKFIEARKSAIVTIVLSSLFFVLTIGIPLLGFFEEFQNLFYFLRWSTDNTKFLWHGIKLEAGDVFSTYDQWAGLTPIQLWDPVNEVWNTVTINTPDAWIPTLILVWMLPFALLGILGTILVCIPPIFSLMSKETPKMFKNTKYGMYLAFFAVGFQWLLFFLYAAVNLPSNPHFGGIPLIGLFIGSFLLYYGQVTWVAQRNWAWYLKQAVNSSIFYIFVIILVIYCVFPFFWAFNLSLQDPTRISGLVDYLPAYPTMRNFTDIFRMYPFHENILNSLILSSITTVLCVLTGAFGGYVIAQFEFKSKRVILSAILSMTMFPALVILVPLYLEYVFVDDLSNGNIKMLNSLPGILIPYITFNLPLTLFLLQNFFEEVPKDLVKAARVDGANNWQVFRKVVLPLAIPGVFTTAILVFIAAWNEFLFASLLLNRENWTIPVVMASFEGIGRFQGFNADLLLAAATMIVTTPLIILVLIFQKQIISGITAGAVKG